MTTPYERIRALRQAGELLERLLQREDVPADLRKQAQGVMRHYPEQWTLDAMALDWQTFIGDKTFGLAPEPERLSPNPDQQRAGNMTMGSTG